MHFMIDYENTGSSGLHGAVELLREDMVTIFYSQSCEKMEKGLLQQLENSGCLIESCKLVRTAKNALDFYIATKVGEVIGQGYEGKIAIVSRDCGYKAIKEYWESCAPKKRRIVLGASIEQCILSANENSERAERIRERLRRVSLEAELARYEEKLRIRHYLEEAFAGTEYAEIVKDLQGILEKKKGNKILYLDTVKRFGMKDGLQIYGKVKELAAKSASEKLPLVSTE